MEEQKTQQGGIKDAVLKATPEDVEKNKTMAMLAYLVFFIPLLTDSKDSPFAKFHANQSLLIFMAGFALSLISMGLITLIITIPGSFALFIFWIMGIMSASNGEMKEVPLIGKIHILDK